MVNYLKYLLDVMVGILTGETLGHLVPHAQRWKDIQKGMVASTQSAFNIILWILGIVVIGLIVFTIINTHKERAKVREQERVYFERKAVEKGLDQKHVNMLSEAVKLIELDQPFRILDSFDIFQHLIQKFESQQSFSDQEIRYFQEMVAQIKDKLGFNKIEMAVQIDSTKQIQKEQHLKIALKKGDQIYEYPAVLVDNRDNQMILDSSKIDLGFLQLDMNTPIEVDFYRENDAGYHFITTLHSLPNREKKFLGLKHTSELRRNQARNFSRMEVNFRFNFYHVPKAKFESIEIDRNLARCENLPVFVGETIDVSGGGLAFHARKKVVKGDCLLLNFQMLSEEHSEPVLAGVVWSSMEKDSNLILVRAKFYNITDKMREQLMKFIYQMQRKYARKLKFAPKKKASV